jgi:c-di-GMP-binding flagellar brake protein YcgR
MIDDRTEFLERRRSERFERNTDISLRHEISGPALPGSLIDLSAGGCSVRLEEPEQFAGAEVIEVRLEASSQSFRMLGWIRHIGDRGRLLGVEFHRLGARETSILNTLIEDLKSASVSIH